MINSNAGEWSFWPLKVIKQLTKNFCLEKNYSEYTILYSWVFHFFLPENAEWKMNDIQRDHPPAW